MNVSNWLTGIVAVLAILGIGGLGWVYVSDKNNGRRLDDLRKDVTDRNERIDFLEREVERDKDTRITLTATVRDQGLELESLNRYVKGSAGPLLELADMQKAHHALVLEHLATLESQGADMLRIHGDRRHVPGESIVREVDRA